MRKFFKNVFTGWDAPIDEHLDIALIGGVLMGVLGYLILDQFWNGFIFGAVTSAGASLVCRSPDPDETSESDEQ